MCTGIVAMRSRRYSGYGSARDSRAPSRFAPIDLGVAPPLLPQQRLSRQAAAWGQRPRRVRRPPKRDPANHLAARPCPSTSDRSHPGPNAAVTSSSLAPRQGLRTLGARFRPHSVLSSPIASLPQGRTEANTVPIIFSAGGTSRLPQATRATPDDPRARVKRGPPRSSTAGALLEHGWPERRLLISPRPRVGARPTRSRFRRHLGGALREVLRELGLRRTGAQRCTASPSSVPERRA